MEGLVYGEVLTGRQFSITRIEVASTVGLVLTFSRSKDVYLVILVGVTNSYRPVLGIPRWCVIYIFCAWHDKAYVLGEVLLVVVKWGTRFTLVVTPRCEDLSGDLVL